MCDLLDIWRISIWIRDIATSRIYFVSDFPNRYGKIFYSYGGFNTPTLCVVTKSIKADCNHLMRTTYPDACVGVVDSAGKTLPKRR